MHMTEQSSEPRSPAFSLQTSNNFNFFSPSFSNPRLEQSGKYLHQSQSCDAHWSFETTRGAASLINHSWKTKPVITGKTSSQEECILGMNVNPRAVLPPNDKQAGCRKGREQDPHVAQTGIRDSSRFTGLGEKKKKTTEVKRHKHKAQKSNSSSNKQTKREWGQRAL